MPEEQATFSIPARLRHFSRERGALSVARSSLGWAAGYVVGRARTRRPPARTFELDGERYPCFHHPYHYTWLNERAIEVPVARRAMVERRGGRVLEVGNVMSHYFPREHEVVDKYETAEGVTNRDVLDIEADAAYDLIVTVSTLEHVGFDETPRDPAKAPRAVEVLKAALAPGGLLLATIPVGYNPALDESIRGGGLGFAHLAALRRAPSANRWWQVSVDDVWDAGYDWLLYTGHGLLVCSYERPA